jgi:hypothetical protein
MHIYNAVATFARSRVVCALRRDLALRTRHSPQRNERIAAVAYMEAPGTVAGSCCLDGVLEINVGGRVFATRRSTLAAVRGSRLAELFGEGSPAFATASRDHDGRVFLDRDGEHFGHVLDYLRRGGQLVGEFSRGTLAQLREDAQYYRLPGLVGEVAAAERQMKQRKVYEYCHMMYGPLLAMEGTPYDTDEKVASERRRRDDALSERTNEGWKVEKLSVDPLGVWLDLFLARPTDQWFQPKGGVVLYGREERQTAKTLTVPHVQSRTINAPNGRRRRPSLGKQQTPQKRQSVSPRSPVSIAAAAVLAEEEATAIALASAPARAARGPLPTAFEQIALQPEVVYDLITDKNPCQGRRPDFITESDVGNIYVEWVQGVPGVAKKSRRPAGLQKWSQGDTLWIKRVPGIKYGPDGKGEVWVKAVYGQVLPVGCRDERANLARTKAAVMADAVSKLAEADEAVTRANADNNDSLTNEIQAASAAAAAAAAAAAVANRLTPKNPTFTYHMYEMHWFNDGFDPDSHWRPSLQGNERADWCAHASLHA